MMHTIGPSHYMLHNIATAGYVPVVYRQHQKKKEKQRQQKKQQERKLSWILSTQEIKSLIISALIFLSVFAWVDVLATSYRNHVLSSKIYELYPLAWPCLSPFSIIIFVKFRQTFNERSSCKSESENYEIKHLLFLSTIFFSSRESISESIALSKHLTT